jgi:glycosyltransferase involved in cell wall biosynthesis
MSFEAAKPYVLVCLPAFNEETNIVPVIIKAKAYASEILVYDDGSADRTTEAAKAAGANVIRDPVNRGYGFALKSLFQVARNKDADIVITIDSDGQHDPNDIPSIIDAIVVGGFDIVIGSRFLDNSWRGKVPAYRSLGIRTITRFAQRASYNNLTDAQSGFRGYSKKAISQLNHSEDGMAASTEILLKAKEKNLIIKEVPITANYGPQWQPTHNPFSQGVAVLIRLIQFVSLKHPLLFYGVTGIILMGIAAYYTNNAVDLFSRTRYISTNMILLSVGAGVVGVVLLATSVILYSLNVLIRGRIQD